MENFSDRKLSVWVSPHILSLLNERAPDRGPTNSPDWVLEARQRQQPADHGSHGRRFCYHLTLGMLNDLLWMEDRERDRRDGQATCLVLWATEEEDSQDRACKLTIKTVHVDRMGPKWPKATPITSLWRIIILFCRAQDEEEEEDNTLTPWPEITNWMVYQVRPASQPHDDTTQRHVADEEEDTVAEAVYLFFSWYYCSVHCNSLIYRARTRGTELNLGCSPWWWPSDSDSGSYSVSNYTTLSQCS